MKSCLLLILVFCLEGCASMYQRSDLANPCSGTNQFECEQWKKNYPKEYEKYKARMKKDEDLKNSYSRMGNSKK